MPPPETNPVTPVPPVDSNIISDPLKLNVIPVPAINFLYSKLLPALLTAKKVFDSPIVVRPVPPYVNPKALFKIKLFSTTTFPPIYIDSPMPTPPLIITDPVVVDVVTEVLLKVLIPAKV